MNSIRPAGFSLVELMIGMATGGMVMLFAFDLMRSVAAKQQIEMVMSQNEQNLGLFSAQIRKYFERGVRVSFRQDPSATIPPALQSNASRIKVYGEGSVTIAADLRSCNEFNPGTSADPANTTYVVIGCCGKAPATLTIQPPFPYVGGPFSQTSACTTGPGLSVYEFAAGGASGVTLKSSRCDASITSLNVMEVGINQVTGGMSYYFQLTRDSRQLVSSVASVADSSLNRTEFYSSVGNAPGATSVQCGEVVR